MDKCQMLLRCLIGVPPPKLPDMLRNLKSTLDGD